MRRFGENWTCQWCPSNHLFSHLFVWSITRRDAHLGIEFVRLFKCQSTPMSNYGEKQSRSFVNQSMERVRSGVDASLRTSLSMRKENEEWIDSFVCGRMIFSSRQFNCIIELTGRMVLLCARKQETNAGLFDHCSGGIGSRLLWERVRRLSE